MKRLASLCALVAATFGLSGCTAVKPWERALLARDDMIWQPDAAEASLRTQVYSSKEASLAGGNAGGGGCGCN